LDLVLRQLRGAATPAALKAELALVALELVDRAGPASEACAMALLEAMAAEAPEGARSRWIEHVSSGSDRLEPATTVRILIAAMERDGGLNTSPHPHERTLAAVTALTGRMASAEAAAALLTGVERSSDAFSRCNLAIELAAAARLLPPEVRIRLCRRAAEVLVIALRQEPEGYKFRKLAVGLAFVAARLDPGEADLMISPVVGRFGTPGPRVWQRTS
jgi:hypothetical protein